MRRYQSMGDYALWRREANHLLAFLALCDILVFVMMFPHYLAALDVFASNSQFRVVHFHTK
ncbi:hypothetical protein NECAME_18882, partial [Necator americanus]